MSLQSLRAPAQDKANAIARRRKRASQASPAADRAFPPPRSPRGRETSDEELRAAQIDRFVWGIVRRKARELVGRAGFRRQDQEDLQQRLLLGVWKRLPAFDPKRGHKNKFVTTIVERLVANIRREQGATKRDDRRVGSLQSLVEVDGRPCALAETLHQSDADARLGRRTRSAEELVNLAESVATELHSLPDHLRDLAERLQTGSLAQASRDLGVPPSTLRGWVQKIQNHFKAAGLRDFL